MPTLPKFDLRDAELRRRLVDGPDSVAAALTCGHRSTSTAGASTSPTWPDATATSTSTTPSPSPCAPRSSGSRPDALLVAEHCYDASRDLDGDGWHGVMNYLSFTRPVW